MSGVRYRQTVQDGEMPTPAMTAGGATMYTVTGGTVPVSRQLNTFNTEVKL